MLSDANPDPLSDASKDIETFAHLAIDHASRAVDDGTIAPAYVPEALLLAACELAARHGGDPEHVAEWLERVAMRLREHTGPEAPLIQ